jgi:hypothetical protein
LSVVSGCAPALFQGEEQGIYECEPPPRACSREPALCPDRQVERPTLPVLASFSEKAFHCGMQAGPQLLLAHADAADGRTRPPDEDMQIVVMCRWNWVG